jgi:hypothetical protein
VPAPDAPGLTSVVATATSILVDISSFVCFSTASRVRGVAM